MNVCYICGKEYGSKSISIHEERCLEIFKKRQSLLPEVERKSLPERTSFENATSLKERNTMARITFTTKIMESCPGCNRTFDTKGKLTKHMKGCEISRKLKSASRVIRECEVPLSHAQTDISHLDINNNKQTKALQTYFCYICGRQYGSNSIEIHEKRCLELFHKQQSFLPPEQRKSVPVRPSEVDALTRERRNSIAIDLYKEHIMEQCQGCGRRFDGSVPLQKHMKGCAAMKSVLRRSTTGIRDCTVPSYDTEGNETRCELVNNDNNINIQEKIRVPRMYVCYLCGRQYGSKSIEIHEKQCFEIFQKEQLQLPKAQRKGTPARPSIEEASTRDARNAAATKIFEENIMEKCEGCGRTFNGSVRLEKHMKGCDGMKKKRRGIRNCIVPGYDDNGNISPEFTNAVNSSDVAIAPMSHLCYICGRQYGSKSIGIHEKKCLEIFLKQQSQLPPEQRKETPARPSTADTTTLEARNAFAIKTYKEKIMETCQGCGRKFDGSVRLQKHMKGCDAVKKIRRSNCGVRYCIVPGHDADDNGLECELIPNANFQAHDANKHLVKMHVCYICGREYGSKSISIHEKQCLEIFNKQQKLLPPKDRKIIPTRPIVQDKTSLEKKNAMARKKYEATIMESCPGCKRTFDEKEKLQKHMKGCIQAKHGLERKAIRECVLSTR